MKKHILIAIIVSLQFYSTSKAQNLDSGLVARYDFSGNANDLSGNNKHATVYGATLTPDRNNSSNMAYSFDGLNDYISPGNIINLTTQNAVTITGWFRHSNINGPINRYVGLIFGKKISGEMGIRVTEENFNELNTFQFGSPGGSVFSNTSFSFNTWDFVVGVFSGSQPEMYINMDLQSNKKQSGGALSSMPSTAEFYIGKTFVWNSSASEHYYHGQLDDIRVYNRTLDTCEMKVLFDGDTAKPVIYPFNQTLTSSTSASYQWYLNGTLIAGATTQSINITQNGQYSVTVPIIDGCYTRTGVLNYEWLGLNSVKKDDFNALLTPNPSRDFSLLTFDNKNGQPFDFKLYDQLGNLVMTSSTSNSSIEIDCRELSNGLYHYRLTDGANNSSGKLVVER